MKIFLILSIFILAFIFIGKKVFYSAKRDLFKDQASWTNKDIIIKYRNSKEIKDSMGRLILPSGQVVDSNFSVTYSENGTYVTPTSSNTISGVSNYEYEVLKNNRKRSIFVLRSQYLQQFLNDMRDIMVYQQSSERINDKLIRTENTRVTME